MDIDSVYHQIGGFGTFQKKAIGLHLLGSVYYGTQIVINIFAGVIPKNQTCSDSLDLDFCDANCSGPPVFSGYDGYHSYAIEVRYLSIVFYLGKSYHLCLGRLSATYPL